MTTSFVVTVEGGKIGDINGDGVLNAIDSNIMKRIVAGSFKIEDEEAFYSIGDINGDGNINAIDSNLLARIISGSYEVL